MAGRAVRFHAEAEQELIEARDWYSERSEVAAQAFALEVNRGIEQILEAPLRYPVRRRGEWQLVLDRFPYTIMYRVTPDEIFVTAIAHQSRRPGYWRHRKPE